MAIFWPNYWPNFVARCFFGQIGRPKVIKSKFVQNGYIWWGWFSDILWFGCFFTFTYSTYLILFTILSCHSLLDVPSQPDQLSIPIRPLGQHVWRSKCQECQTVMKVKMPGGLKCQEGENVRNVKCQENQNVTSVNVRMFKISVR